MASRDGRDYFTSYSDLQVHELMLKDRPRTVAYRRFFEENRDFVKGKVVMDVGAGTGILSLFAATAGAKKVYAVEASTVALLCEEIVKDNNLGSIIEVIHKKVENVQLPEGVKVDIIVSEWMGFYLLHESMLDSVLCARDKFLAPSGILVPSRACLYVAPVDMTQHFEERAEYWSNIYGFDFSPIASSINMTEVSQPLIKCLDASCVRSAPLKVLDLDLKMMTVDEVQSFNKTVKFPMSDVSRVHGFGFWFDVHFEMYSSTNDSVKGSHSNLSQKNYTNSGINIESTIDHSGDAKQAKVTEELSKNSTPENQEHVTSKTDGSALSKLSLTKSSMPTSSSPSLCLATGPSDPPTHWKQTIVFLPQTIMVMEDISILCTIKMDQDSLNKRHYNITLELGDGTESDGEQEGSEDCSIDGEDSDDSTGHPTPCFCGSNRCRLISALIEKYDTEHQELNDEAENVETRAEVEAAKEIDAQIEQEGWPMDSSNLDGGDD